MKGYLFSSNATRYVIARVHPTNDHFQYIRSRRGYDYTNSLTEALVFDSPYDANGVLSRLTCSDHADSFVNALD